MRYDQPPSVPISTVAKNRYTSRPPPRLVEAEIDGYEIWVEREHPAGTGAFVLWVLDVEGEHAAVDGEAHASLAAARDAAERLLHRRLPWKRLDRA
jgi:hypothetical protein